MPISKQEWEKMVQDTKNYINKNLVANNITNAEIIDNSDFEDFVQFKNVPFAIKINNAIYWIVCLKQQALQELEFNFFTNNFPKTKILNKVDGLIIYKNLQGYNVTSYIISIITQFKVLKNETAKICALLAKTARKDKELYLPRFNFTNLKNPFEMPPFYVMFNKNKTSTYLFKSPVMLNAKEELGRIANSFIEDVLFETAKGLYFSKGKLKARIKEGFNVFIASFLKNYLKYLQIEQKQVFLNNIKRFASSYLIVSPEEEKDYFVQLKITLAKIYIEELNKLEKELDVKDAKNTNKSHKK